jgi:outer membrane lipoprotein-sorting protein
MTGRGGLLGIGVLLLAAVACIGTPFAAPSAAAAPSASPAVEEIVARYVAARGGLKKLQSIQTLRQRGRATMGAERQALVTRELKRPGRIRFEFTVQGVTGVYISDGQRGWKVSPFDGEMGPQPLGDQVIAEASEQADIEGPLVDWKAKGHQVELVGREANGGSQAYKLKVTLKGGAVLYNYIDVKSMYLVRTDSSRQVRGRPLQLETTFSDFKKTDGILFPRQIEIAAAGRPQRLRIVVDKVEVNPPLSDARFAVPASAKP